MKGHNGLKEDPNENCGASERKDANHEQVSGASSQQLSVVPSSCHTRGEVEESEEQANRANHRVEGSSKRAGTHVDIPNDDHHSAPEQRGESRGLEPRVHGAEYSGEESVCAHGI